MSAERIAVIGLGRIGLPTAACFADAGFHVLGFDVDEDRIRQLLAEELDGREPGLAELVSRVLSSGKLRLSTRLEPADTFILCLPTPLDDLNRCDLSYLEKGLEFLAPVLRHGNLVVLESTVPVHTTRDFVAPKLTELGVNTDSILIAYAPERIISGRMLHEIRSNDRVIGGLTHAAAERAKSLYSSFVKGEIVLTDSSTAELVKLIENTYRDINIAFANEVALFSDREGIDVWEAVSLANRHPRVHIHTPGAAVGGHCIPVVPYFLAQSTRHSTLIRTARDVNEAMPRYISNLVMRAVDGIERPRVTLMGAAYKPNVSDTINSPAAQILPYLQGENVQVSVCDPLVDDANWSLVDVDQALESDCIVFLVAHDVFKEMDPRPPAKGRGKVIDATGSIDLSKWASQGWLIHAFGRPYPPRRASKA